MDWFLYDIGLRHERVNPDHKYHPDVIEFFSTIMYLGGRRTFILFEGPCAMAKVVDFGINKMSVGVK